MEKIKQLLRLLGPGFISGSADDDPTAVVTYSQSGAEFGYHQLWTTLFVLPLMIAMQEMSGRIGMVTGKGIALILKQHYHKLILLFIVFLLTIANIINIGADLGAVAESARLLWHLPFPIWLAVLTIGILLIQVLIPYKQYANILKYITLALLAYIISSVLVKQQWLAILHNTFIPFISFQKKYLLNIVAILGGNISPYLFFWQANQETEEIAEKRKVRDVDRGKPKITKKDLRSLNIDTVIGMIFSNLILFFIEIGVASTLGAHGITNVDSPLQAAQALKPVAGSYASLLFVIGIFGSGMLAVPVLAGTSGYAIAEIFGWRTGLAKKFYQARNFYITIIVVTLLGVLINLLPIKPFVMLIYSAALNGVITPLLIVFILLIANNKKLMGKRTNTLLSNTVGGITALIMSLAAVAFCFSLVSS